MGQPISTFKFKKLFSLSGLQFLKTAPGIDLMTPIKTGQVRVGEFNIFAAN